MKVDRTIIVYTTQPAGLPKGWRYANPRFFSIPGFGVKKAVIVGKWHKVEEAYKKAGIEIVKFPGGHRFTGLPGHTVPEFENKDGLVLDTVAFVGESKVAPPTEPAPAGPTEIPANWAELTWPELRKLATALSGRPVLNKTDANDAIEKAIAERAVAE